MKTITSFYEFGSSKISKLQNSLDQTNFKRGWRGVVKKNYTFFKIFIRDEIFSHLLQNLELALKFQTSEKKSNLSEVLTFTIESTRQNIVVEIAIE